MFNVFGYCSGLASVTIGSGVTTINRLAFGWCSSLTSLTIPSSVTTIGDGAFRNCTGLVSITSLAMTAPTIEDTTFRNITRNENGVLYVPIGSSGYDIWMNTRTYYLGWFYWTKVEQ